MADDTYAGVEEKLSDRESVFGELHADMRLDESMIIGGEVALRGFPGDFRAKVPPVAGDAVRRLRDQILVGEPADGHVRTPSPKHRGDDASKKQREKEDAENVRELERWLRAELALIERNGHESPLMTVANHCIGLGLGVIAYPFVKGNLPKPPRWHGRAPRDNRERQALQEYERKRRGAFPFDVYAVHPLTAFFDPYHTVIEDMIVKEEVLMGSYAGRFPHLNIPTKSFGSSGTLVSYCSPEWYGYWLDGRPLLTGQGVNGDGCAPNPTGVLWYKMARSGFGFASGKAAWKDAIKGVIRDARPVILSLYTDYNVQEIMKLIYLFPPKNMLVKSEQGRQEAEDYRMGPGSVWLHGEDVVELPTDVTQIPQWAFQIQNLNTVTAEAHLGSRVLSGVDEGGNNASVLRTRVGLAEAPTRASKASIEAMASAMLSDMVYIQRHKLEGPLSIPSSTGYVEFKTERITDDMIFEVDLTPLTPEEKAFRLDDGLKRLQVGAMSLITYLRLDPDIDDPEQERSEIDADTILKVGDVVKWASTEALRRVQEETGMPVPGGLAGDAGQGAQVQTLGSPGDMQQMQPMLGGPPGAQ